MQHGAMFGYGWRSDEPIRTFTDAPLPRAPSRVPAGIPAGCSGPFPPFQTVPIMEDESLTPSQSMDSESRAVLRSNSLQSAMLQSMVPNGALHTLPHTAHLSVSSPLSWRGPRPARVEEICEVTGLHKQTQLISHGYKEAVLELPVGAYDVPKGVGDSPPVLRLDPAAFLLGHPLRPANGPGAPAGAPLAPHSIVSASPPVLSLELREPRGDQVHSVSATPVLDTPRVETPQMQETLGGKPHKPHDMHNESVNSSLTGIYEVETLLDVRETADGKREFLIKWKGWGPKWNNWEPEEHILDKRMLRKFNNKKRPMEGTQPPSQDVDDFAMNSKRRCAKQAAVKARMAARNEDEEDDDEDA